MEQEKELGTQLKNRREEMGLTIGQVVQETKISSRYIQAIETGNFDVIPGEVYLKGFIKTYAKLLNLDPAEIVNQISLEDSSAGNDKQYVEQSLYPQKGESDFTSASEKSLPKRSDKHSLHGRSNKGPAIRKTIQIAAIVIVLLFLLTYAYQNIVLENLPLPEPDDQNNEPVDQNDNDPPEPEPDVPEFSIISDTSGSASVDVDADQIIMRIEAIELCWLRAQIDDNPPESQTMGPGDVLDLTAENTIQLRAGNSGGIEIYLFGEILPVSGQSGGVKNYTIQIQP